MEPIILLFLLDKPSLGLEQIPKKLTKVLRDWLIEKKVTIYESANISSVEMKAINLTLLKNYFENYKLKKVKNDWFCHLIHLPCYCSQPCCPRRHLSCSYPKSPRFSIVPSASPIQSVEEVNIVCVDDFGF